MDGMNLDKIGIEYYNHIRGDPMGILDDLFVMSILDDEEEHAWRSDCEDGSEYGIDPDDFDTEDEYNEALEEAKYGWRDYAEDGDEYGLDPELYETEAEYEEALEEAKHAWREDVVDASLIGVDPDDYDTLDDYKDAIRDLFDL